MYVFLEVGNPDTYKVFPNPKCSKIAGKYMRFCGQQRGEAQLLPTKSYVCTCNITGLRAGESL